MALLGSIIKKGIELTAAISSETEDIVSAQISQLTWLLSKAKETSFGQYYGFDDKSSSNDPRRAFAQEIPIFQYEKMNELWWKQQQKYPNITWPGKPDYFALSSGTTGKNSKRIPITPDLISHMRSVGTDLVKNLSAFDISEEVFEKEVFILSSSADLKENDFGFAEGEVSGINVHNFPGWYDFFYRPGKEIAEIDDWDERLDRIVKEAPDWDIGAIAGIPSWILLMLKAIIEKHKLKTIHDLWPNLEVYSTGGVAYAPYDKGFREVCDRDLVVIDTYLASEGFFGFRANPKHNYMKLAQEHQIYYEYIPFDERGFDEVGNLLADPVIHCWEDVEEEQEYALLISTCAGAWRYLIGDTIKFKNKTTSEFVITGRTKFFLNVVGSQLSEEKINAAMKKLAEKYDTTIDEFCVSALENGGGEYYHQWIISCEDQVDQADLTSDLDEILKGLNKNYRVARNKALRGIEVKLISKDQFYAWLEQHKKKGGQVKTPKVMSSEKMQDFLSFLTSQ